jgi:SAM-dependent methyltransferase
MAAMYKPHYGRKQRRNYIGAPRSPRHVGHNEDKKRDMVGSEYSRDLNSDIYYLHDARITAIKGGSDIILDETDDIDEDGTAAINTNKRLSKLSNQPYRFSRMFALQSTNQKNIYSRCLSMLSTGSHGDAIRSTWIRYMNEYPVSHDSKVIEQLANVYANLQQKEEDNFRDLQKRAQKRLQGLGKILESEVIEPLRNSAYVDFGGNMWYNAAAIGSEYKAKRTIIIDVMPKHQAQPQGIEYIQLDKEALETKIPLESESVALITMFMVAHHINDIKLKQALMEFYRILKPGGVVVVREHNMVNTFDDTDDTKGLKDLFDSLHLMHCYVWKSETEFMCGAQSYDNMGTFYRSFDAIIMLFRNAGFKQYKKADINTYFRTNIYNTGTLSFFKP